MITILDKTNVAAADSEYPFGNIRDKTTLLDGTPVNVETYGDMHQFFMKMIFESGISPNNLPDNAYNGWQLWEALQKACQDQRRYKRYYVNLSQTGTNDATQDNQAENDLSVSPTFSRTGAGVYRGTFGANEFPDANKVYRWTSNEGNDTHVKIEVSGTNIILIKTFSAGIPDDDILNKTSIMIRVYP